MAGPTQRGLPPCLDKGGTNRRPRLRFFLRYCPEPLPPHPAPKPSTNETLRRSNLTSTHLLVQLSGRCLTAASRLPRSRLILCATWQFGVLVLPRGSFTRTHFGSTSRTVKLRYQSLDSKGASPSSISSSNTRSFIIPTSQPLHVATPLGFTS